MQHVRGHRYPGPKAWSVWSLLLLLLGVGSGCSLKPPEHDVKLVIDAAALEKGFEQTKSSGQAARESTVIVQNDVPGPRFESPNRFFAHDGNSSEDYTSGFSCLAVNVTGPMIPKRELPRGTVFHPNYEPKEFSSLIQVIPIRAGMTTIETSIKLDVVGEVMIQIWGLQTSTGNCPSVDDREDRSGPGNDDDQVEVYALAKMPFRVKPGSNVAELTTTMTTTQMGDPDNRVLVDVGDSSPSPSPSPSPPTVTILDNYVIISGGCSTTGGPIQIQYERAGGSDFSHGGIPCVNGQFTQTLAVGNFNAGSSWTVTVSQDGVPSAPVQVEIERFDSNQVNFSYKPNTTNVGNTFIQQVPTTPVTGMTLNPKLTHNGQEIHADCFVIREYSRGVLGETNNEDIIVTDGPVARCPAAPSQLPVYGFGTFSSDNGQIVFRHDGNGTALYRVKIQALLQNGTLLKEMTLNLAFYPSVVPPISLTAGAPTSWQKPNWLLNSSQISISPPSGWTVNNDTITPPSAAPGQGNLSITIQSAELIYDSSGPLTVPQLTLSQPFVVSSAAPSGYQKVAAGKDHTCGITTLGQLLCWGNNAYGKLGIDSNEQLKVTPTQVSDNSIYQTVDAGYEHSCGITTTGVLKCWGNNGAGRLGDGTTITQRLPKTIDPGTPYRAISAGGAHTCGITTTGTLKCWGANNHGQLGDDTDTARLSPVVVDSGTSYMSITAGEVHTCGITTTGALKCWGNNGDGRLGDGTLTTRKLPETINPGTPYRAISAEQKSTCGITTTSILKCWGDLYPVQLGSKSLPHEPKPNSLYKTVDVGLFTTCAITSENKRHCWGANGFGEHGDGTTNVKTGINVITEQHTFTVLSIGYSHSCGLTTNQQLFCWGKNDLGQLGTQDNTPRTIPQYINLN